MTVPGGGPDGTEIAVVGMAGRFPGARGLDELWRNLCGGVDAVRRLTPEELAALGVPAAVRADPDHVPVTAQMPDLDRFDAAFFGIDPDEAEILDPQLRVLLELAWEALEDAACDPEAERRPVGVFAGGGLSTYLLLNLAAPAPRQPAVDPFHALVANSGDGLASRISYKLDLTGPSFTVQSACSSSLVAVHLACASLLNGECDLALAGAVSINVSLLAGYLARPGGMLAPGGRCRAFGAGADGILFGHGGGMVALRRLEDALAAGDPVRAVLRGSAVNNDGHHKVGYGAPSIEGQTAVLTEAWAAAGIDPATLSYIEGHGTGTRLGDPIEVQALTRALRPHARRRGFCALGSIKSNIGHLDTAAGIAGLIKTVLALEHRQIPPSLHGLPANPQCDLASGPLRLAAALTPWPAAESHPRRAGVSAFGLGGTNAHVVVEEAPPLATAPSRAWDVLLLSARGGAALERATDALAAHLEPMTQGSSAPPVPLPSGESPGGRPAPPFPATPSAPPLPAGRQRPPLSDIAFTLQVGRRRFAHRRAVVCAAGEDAVALLRHRDPERTWTLADEATDRPVAFALPEPGGVRPGMGAGLYRDEPRFHRELDRCAELFRPHLGLDLRAELLAPHPGRDPSPADPVPDRDLAAARDRAAAFAVACALSCLWRSWGVRPAALLGAADTGPVAACLTGEGPLEAAVPLVVAPTRTAGSRGRRTSGATAAAGGASGYGTPAVPIEPGLVVLVLGPPPLGPGRRLATAAGAVGSTPPLASLPAAGDPRSESLVLLTALGHLWTLGVRPDWAAFQGDDGGDQFQRSQHHQRRQRVSLPTYPFERQRFWRDAPGVPRPLGVLASTFTAEKATCAGTEPCAGTAPPGDGDMAAVGAAATAPLPLGGPWEP